MNRAGFTLVEVLLAALLVIIMIGVLFASFFVPIQAIRSGKAQVFRLEEAAVFLDVFSAEIAAVFSEAGSLAGDAAGVAFVTAAGTDLGLRRVAYRVHEQPEGDGVVVHRADAPPWEAAPEEGAPVFRAETLALAYHDGQEWYEQWERPEIPRLVSLETVHRGQSYRVLCRPRTGVDSDPGPDSDPGADGGGTP